MVEGPRLSGRYKLEEQIARGGMGTVHAATDERLGRRVAVKLLRDDLAEDADFVERFRREARSVATLIHPHIANVFDYGEDGGHRYIVMELVEGMDLARLLRADGALMPDRARRIAVQVCEALGYAHASGVVHRDVKPANIIVSAEDAVKVTDFGIAQAAGDVTLTAAGSVLGTAQYISPEQASDRDVGPPSDVYSMGIVLYEMLTGVLPFTGESPIALAMRHVSEEVPRPSRAQENVPEDLDAVVARATAKRPEQRFGDGTEMGAALTGSGASPATAVMGVAGPPTTVLGGGVRATAIERETPGTDRFAAAPTRRRRRGLGVALGIAVTILLLAATALLAMTLLGRDDERRPRRGQAGGAPTQQPASESPAPVEEPEVVTVPAGLVGSNVRDAEGVLREAGLRSATEVVESEEDKDIVVQVDPEEGTELSVGDTVTLLVSEGPPPDEEAPPDTPPGQDEDGGPPGHGKPKGKGKDKGKRD
ncbi:MAG: protein kinase [Actinomycetota bacterium]